MRWPRRRNGARVPQLGPFLKVRNRLVMLGNHRYVVAGVDTRYRDGHVVVQLELVPESVFHAGRAPSRKRRAHEAGHSRAQP